MEEFECRFAMSGEEQIFFQKYFTPTAMLKTYMKSHPSASIKECLTELFTITRNSKTQDLFPEVTGVCTECAKYYFDNMESYGAEEICVINKLVLKKQFQNNFQNPAFSKFGLTNNLSSENCILSDLECSSSKQILSQTGLINSLKEATMSEAECQGTVREVISGESDPSDELLFNPFFSAAESDFQIFNPFSRVNNQEFQAGIEKIHPGRLFPCDICGKKFSDIEFVDFHVKLFHPPAEVFMKLNQDPKLKLKYVDSADISINSCILQSKKHKNQPQTQKVSDKSKSPDIHSQTPRESGRRRKKGL